MSEESDLYIGKIEKEVPVQSGDDNPLMRIQELTTMAAGLVALKTERDRLRLALIEMEFNELEGHYYYSCSECLANRVLRDAALKGEG